MIGLDSNIIIRLVVQDDKVQTERAFKLAATLSPTEPGFVSIVTIAEVHWVLCRLYKYSATTAVGTIKAFLGATDIRVENPSVVAEAFSKAAKGVDLADALILAAGKKAGCRKTVTFDKHAAKHPGFELI